MEMPLAWTMPKHKHKCDAAESSMCFSWNNKMLTRQQSNQMPPGLQTVASSGGRLEAHATKPVAHIKDPIPIVSRQTVVY